MTTEESPLLGGQLHSDADSIQRTLYAEDVYNRFSHEQKRTVLAIVSLTGLIPMFVSGSFVPSIPQISNDLGKTPAAVSLGVSLSVLANALGVMFWSAYSSFYGRRTMYLCGMPFTIIGSFAVAASTGLNSLLFWRFIQTFGCSASAVLGVAAISDVYEVEERGTAMGVFIGASVFGLAIAPLIGGILTQYWSWRGFHISLGVWSAIQWLLLVLYLPETAHPGSRGIDKQQGSGKLVVFINPLRCLSLLRSPNIMAITLANTFALMSDWVLLIPIAYTIGAKYGIRSEGLIGTLFLSSGLGNLVGSPISGRMSDMAVRRTKKEGVWVPEDRLRAAWLGELVLIPLSVTAAGFTTAYIDGTVGLVISLVCLFTNGLGVNMVLAPTGTYTVDAMPSRSAEVAAALTAFRSLLLAPVSALVMPSVEKLGVAATNSISGVLALFGYFLIWLTIRYGEQMRAFVDVGFPDFSSRTSIADDTSDLVQD